jgi:predicted DCC family thiol-disulfide oxidoreductase YuxK
MREPVSTSTDAADPAGPVLLYDGACGLCGATVRFVLRHERRRTLRFAALGGRYARGVVARHPGLDGTDSVVWVDPATGIRPERVLLRSAAALRVAGYLGGAWRLLRVVWLVPRPLRDAAYDLVARHRHRLSAAGACVVPGPEERSRFLDPG